MATFKKIPIPHLPKDFTQQIHDHIRLYSVTMLISDEDDSEVIPCSGTLSKVARYDGIITARHVWEEAKNHKYLLVLVGKGPYAIETKFLDALVPPVRGVMPDTNVSVPDIAFMKFPSIHSSKIEAFGKTFYSLDKRIDDQSFKLYQDQGYWTLFGNPMEWLNPEGRKVSSFVYGTGIDKKLEIAGWDYFVMDLNIEENPDIPGNCAGMSGGGIWRTCFFMDNNLEHFRVENVHKDIVFSGVSFYQTGKKGRQIIGHGPKSIYECLYEFAVR